MAIIIYTLQQKILSIYKINFSNTLTIRIWGKVDVVRIPNNQKIIFAVTTATNFPYKNSKITIVSKLNIKVEGNKEIKKLLIGRCSLVHKYGITVNTSKK